MYKAFNYVINKNFATGNPHIAQASPYRKELEPGFYKWCSCGLSADQPWCDGISHKSLGMKPVPTKIQKKGVYKICGCKYTKTPPYCDNSHWGLELGKGEKYDK